MQLRGQPGDLLGQPGVLRQQREVLLGEGAFAPQYLGLTGFEVALALDVGVVVLLDGGIAELVAVGLAGLGEEDQRRRVGRLGREREVQQDERIRIPSEADRGGVDRDPQDDQDGLSDDEPGVPKKRAKRSASTPKRSLPNAP